MHTKAASVNHRAHTADALGLARRVRRAQREINSAARVIAAIGLFAQVLSLAHRIAWGYLGDRRNCAKGQHPRAFVTRSDAQTQRASLSSRGVIRARAVRNWPVDE